MSTKILQMRADLENFSRAALALVTDVGLAAKQDVAKPED
jgi:hypothetical protein